MSRSAGGAASCEVPDVSTTIPFPYTPYQSQRALMNQLYDLYEQGNGSVGIFESPTGTGKTMSIICASLQWMLPLSGDRHRSRVISSDQFSEAEVSLGRVQAESAQAMATAPQDTSNSRDTSNSQHTSNSRDTSNSQDTSNSVYPSKAEHQQDRKEQGGAGGCDAAQVGPTREEDDASDWIESCWRDMLESKAESKEMELQSMIGEVMREYTTKIPLRSVTRAELSASRAVEEEVGYKVVINPLSHRTAVVRSAKGDTLTERQTPLKTYRQTPQLIYAARTHTQLEQFAAAIKHTDWHRRVARTQSGKRIVGGSGGDGGDSGVRVVILGSRPVLCCNSRVSKLGSKAQINERCQQLQQRTSPASPQRNTSAGDDVEAEALLARSLREMANVDDSEWQKRVLQRITGGTVSSAVTGQAGGGAVVSSADSLHAASRRVVKRRAVDGSDASLHAKQKAQLKREVRLQRAGVFSAPSGLEGAEGVGGTGDKARKGRDAQELVAALEEEEKGCRYLRDKERLLVMRTLMWSMRMSRADQITYGKALKACPYYSGRHAASLSHVICVPYASLVQEGTRRSLGINLQNSIVVVDEAHNLADAIVDAHSASITALQARQASAELREYISRYRQRFHPRTLRNLELLQRVCDRLVAFLVQRFAVVQYHYRPPQDKAGERADRFRQEGPVAASTREAHNLADTIVDAHSDNSAPNAVPGSSVSRGTEDSAPDPVSANKSDQSLHPQKHDEPGDQTVQPVTVSSDVVGAVSLQERGARAHPTIAAPRPTSGKDTVSSNAVSSDGAYVHSGAEGYTRWRSSKDHVDIFASQQADRTEVRLPTGGAPQPKTHVDIFASATSEAADTSSKALGAVSDIFSVSAAADGAVTPRLPKKPLRTITMRIPLNAGTSTVASKAAVVPSSGSAMVSAVTHTKHTGGVGGESRPGVMKSASMTLSAYVPSYLRDEAPSTSDQAPAERTVSGEDAKVVRPAAQSVQVSGGSAVSAKPRHSGTGVSAQPPHKAHSRLVSGHRLVSRRAWTVAAGLPGSDPAPSGELSSGGGSAVQTAGLRSAAHNGAGLAKESGSVPAGDSTRPPVRGSGAAPSCLMRELHRTDSALCQSLFPAHIQEVQRVSEAGHDAYSVTRLERSTAFMRAVGLDNVNLLELIAFVEEKMICRKLNGFTARDAVTGARGTSRMYAVMSLLRSLTALSQHSEILYKARLSAATRGAGSKVSRDCPCGGCHGRYQVFSRDVAGDGASVKVLLLHASSTFVPMVRQARATVLVGGTLSPFASFRHSLLGSLPSQYQAQTLLPAITSKTGQSRRFGQVRTLSCSHVVPAQNIFTAVLSSGPGPHRGAPECNFNFSFKHQRRRTQQHESLGRMVMRLCSSSAAHGGIVVFFTSYKALRSCVATWKTGGSQSLLARMRSVAVVLWESPAAAARAKPHRPQQSRRSRHSGGSQPSASRGSASVEHKTPASTGGSTGAADGDSVLSGGGGAQLWNLYTQSLNTSSQSSRASGSAEGSADGVTKSSSEEGGGLDLSPYGSCIRGRSVLLCVLGGKLSEGIDFKDHLARVVCICGLPFPNPFDPVLKARVQFLLKTQPQSQSNRTAIVQRFYRDMCMRVVNQAIGRAIRHANDWCSLILCDERFHTAPVVDLLPSWIKNDKQFVFQDPSCLPGVSHPRMTAGRMVGMVLSFLLRKSRGRV